MSPMKSFTAVSENDNERPFEAVDITDALRQALEYVVGLGEGDRIVYIGETV